MQAGSVILILAGDQLLTEGNWHRQPLRGLAPDDSPTKTHRESELVPLSKLSKCNLRRPDAGAIDSVGPEKLVGTRCSPSPIPVPLPAPGKYQAKPPLKRP